MDRAEIERYARGPEQFHAAYAGLSRGDLLAFPIPGTWSIQQIAVHLLESDLIASHRMKRIVAEDRPLLIGYDETKFAQSLFYDDEPLDEVLTLFQLNRTQTARILRKLPDTAFARRGVHNERGLVTLGEMVSDYAQHLDHHLAFVVKKRTLLGKPLPG